MAVRVLERGEPEINSQGHLVEMVTYEVDTPLGPVPMVMVERSDPARLADPRPHGSESPESGSGLGRPTKP